MNKTFDDDREELRRKGDETMDDIDEFMRRDAREHEEREKNKPLHPLFNLTPELTPEYWEKKKEEDKKKEELDEIDREILRLRKELKDEGKSIPPEIWDSPDLKESLERLKKVTGINATK